MKKICRKLVSKYTKINPNLRITNGSIAKLPILALIILNKTESIKYALTILLVLFKLPVKAQDSSTTSKDSRQFVDLYFGYKVLDKPFYSQLNTSKNAFKWNSPLQIIGIGFAGELNVNMNGRTFENIGYSQVLPQTIYIEDTLKGKIRGGIFNVAVGPLIKSKHIDIHCYAGFNTGRLIIYQNELIRQKNPFFSPKIGIQPRFRFGKVGLTAVVEYEYDVSRNNWRRTFFANKDKVTIAPLNQSGITAQVGLTFLVE
ncbi:MAG TPA: hypothetical protein VFF27_04135 [Bacteroidia bacterium]|jgi:hypothetical protein|nr:hypothetical protein [Bacteroidia bacterium]